MGAEGAETVWAITIVCGVALIGLGVAAKLITGTPSNTPLYATSGVGVPLVVLGLLASRERFRKHAMHVAAMVALLGFIGAAVMAGPKLPTLLTGGTPMRTNADGTQSDATGAVVTTSLMGLICLVFVGLCVNSFVQARLLRKRAEQPEAPART